MPGIDVELKSVTKEFSTRRGETTVKAVDNVSLQIMDGEFFRAVGAKWVRQNHHAPHDRGF